MTYQLALYGCDGIVLASDQRELTTAGDPTIHGHGINQNNISKIRVHSSHKLAWMFDGGSLGRIASASLGNLLENEEDLSHGAIKRALKQAANDSFVKFPHLVRNDAYITLATGIDSTIFRAKIMPSAFFEITEPNHTSPIIAGQTYNLAGFIPVRYYSSKMSVDQLCSMAAYTISAAHDIDTLAIDGLDIAIYKISTGKFELINLEQPVKLATEIDSGIRHLLFSAPQS
ncbi:MAG: hypothetical protein ABSC08_20420 [Bryobacteraceae bacterium]|jgi:hypothetical protein